MKKLLFNSLPINVKNKFTKDEYNKKSFFQNKLARGKTNKNYKIAIFAKILRDEILRLLNKKKIIKDDIKLEQIHKYINKSLREYDLKHGVNKISQMFYENDTEFKKKYFSFIKYLSKEVFKFPFYFQAVPTIRIQCPQAKNSHFYPMYHNDISLGHPFEEINLWIPLTNKSIIENHGFRIMSFKNSKRILKRFDFSLDHLLNNCIKKKKINFKLNKIAKKVGTKYGSMLAFDARCLHSSETMLNQSRVSIDIRIIPVKEYSKMKYRYQGLGKRKILFEPGKCYFKKAF